MKERVNAQNTLFDTYITRNNILTSLVVIQGSSTKTIMRSCLILLHCWLWLLLVSHIWFWLICRFLLISWFRLICWFWLWFWNVWGLNSWYILCLCKIYRSVHVKMIVNLLHICLTFCLLRYFACFFCCLLIFFSKSFFLKNSFLNIIRVSNSLGPDQA